MAKKPSKYAFPIPLVVLEAIILAGIVVNIAMERNYRRGSSLVNDGLIFWGCIRTIGIFILVGLALVHINRIFTLRSVRNRTFILHIVTVLFLAGSLIGLPFSYNWLRHYQDRAFFASHQSEFNEILALAQATDCFHSSQECFEVITMPPHIDELLGVDLQSISSSANQTYVMVVNVPSRFPFLYVENLAAFTGEIQVSDLTRQCYPIADHWFLCR